MTQPLAPGLAATAFGAYLTVTFGGDLYFAQRSKRWPTVQGRVRGCDVSPMTAERAARASAVIEYEYQVGGIKYTSRRIDYGGRGFGRDAGNVLARYSEGEPVGVRYDPSEPKRAILMPGATPGNFGRLLFGLIILAVGLLLLAS